MLLALGSVVFLVSESLWNRDHILLSQVPRFRIPGAIPSRPHTNCLINHNGSITLTFSLFLKFCGWNFNWLYGNDNCNGVLIESCAYLICTVGARTIETAGSLSWACNGCESNEMEFYCEVKRGTLTAETYEYMKVWNNLWNLRAFYVAVSFFLSFPFITERKLYIT
jgi:hypothetical protein